MKFSVRQKMGMADASGGGYFWQDEAKVVHSVADALLPEAPYHRTTELHLARPSASQPVTPEHSAEFFVNVALPAISSCKKYSHGGAGV